MSKAIYPGSFDPFTNGHRDLVERASQLFESLVIAVGVNPSKQSVFSVEERMALIRECVQEIGRGIEVVSFAGLLVNAAREQGATCVVRGIRGTSDLDSEFAMASTNRTLSPELDTAFLAPSPQWSFVSSRWVREVARGGGEVGALVPAAVAAALARRLTKD